jgi:carboxypeptidase Q
MARHSIGAGDCVRPPPGGSTKQADAAMSAQSAVRCCIIHAIYRRSIVLTRLAFLSVLAATSLPAQRLPVDDPVLRRMWDEGINRSHLRELGHVLLDSIGPRLTGSPADLAGHDWLKAVYASWGIRALNEQYASGAKRWRRGPTHVDLVAPRVRTLVASMEAWSPGTTGTVEGEAIVIPPVKDAAAFEAWLPAVRGKLVLLNVEAPTCRPDDEWRRFADSATFARMRADRERAFTDWRTSMRNTGLSTIELPARLEAAGALGLLVNRWLGRYDFWKYGSGPEDEGWGVMETDGATTTRTPMIVLSCEDYGLVARLAKSHRAPRLRMSAESELLGPAPVLNTIAEIPGTEHLDEYVVLSAHFDSWDGASGATDNGTGTLVMMEAMRILREVYPRPKRTILVRHWSGEEQGIGTSRAFRADMTAVAGKTQAVFNQDTGTGRVTRISISGLPDATQAWARWAARLPIELSYNLAVGPPTAGTAGRPPSLCAGFPVFQFFSNGTANQSNAQQSWDYGYTHHTTIDTYDKIVFDEVARNAVLTAMVAYLAAEDPARTATSVPPEQQVDPVSGARQTWQPCP